jgi:murein DD-endopeptidase MepM/ murein hydrolase activator NlpD
MKSNQFLRVVALLVFIAALLPAGNANAQFVEVIPPAEMFQLPWEQGKAWVALDGFDNGAKRAKNSPHNYMNGGAVDFAPYNGIKTGVDTSSFWVTAAAAGTVTEVGWCHLKLDHGNGWTSEYQFLANIQVRVGDAVYRNQRLAVIADGLRQPYCLPHVGEGEPHLHFSVRPNMRNVTFAGWLFEYVPILNWTTFTKNGVKLGSYRPLMNLPGLQIVLRQPLEWDTLYTGSVDAARYERWPLTLTGSTTFTLTATSTTGGLSLLVLLLDASGNEIARSTTGGLDSSQPAGSYFVQVQPQAGQGFYSLIAHKEDQPLPTGPYVYTEVALPAIDVSGMTLATTGLGNVPAEGYTSTEFTCTYDASLVDISNITPAALFGPDPVMAINGPQNGTFIVAIAGSKGSKATSSGAAFTFDVKGLQAGQTTLECQARISKGDNLLTSIEYIPATLTIRGSGPQPTPTSVTWPTPTVMPDPLLTPTPTLPASNWLTFTNSRYGFEFQYPGEGQIAEGRTDYAARINLPFAPGTNLGEKYLDVTAVENADPCQSPLATSSMLETSETVTINSLSFLKQTGGDGSAGHTNKWVAYSTGRGSVCVSLDFVLRIANPGVSPTPPAAYDEAAETAVFGQIVSTFVWLALPEATPTPEASPTPLFTPTPTPLPSSSGTLTGQVNASKTVTVILFNADSTIAASTTADSGGAFSLESPAGVYSVIATASGFLNAQGSASLAAGQVTSMPTVSLLAGDIDGNNVIDQFDALTIGMSYNTSLPAAADLNNDGIIDVLDLELLARSYRKFGPQAWD